MSNPDFEEFSNVDEAVDAPAPATEEQVVEAAEETVSTREESTTTSRLEFLKTLTVYDAMLIASALSISIAILLMFLELTSFGGIFFQWRTSEAYAEPLAPPS